MRWLVGEPFGVRVVGCGQDGGALLAGFGGGAVVDVGGGVQSKAGVAMLFVVPGKEQLAVLPGGLD